MAVGVRADEWDADSDAGSAMSVTGSFESTYRSLWAPLVRLAWAMTGSRAVAEDIVQEVFLRAEPVWAEVASPRAYLRASVVNAVRSRQRRRLLELRHRPPGREATHIPEMDELWPVLIRLPARQRDALALRYYEDLSLEEVARLLGCPLGTAKSLVHRGLAALRRELGS